MHNTHGILCAYNIHVCTSNSCSEHAHTCIISLPNTPLVYQPSPWLYLASMRTLSLVHGELVKGDNYNTMPAGTAIILLSHHSTDDPQDHPAYICIPKRITPTQQVNLYPDMHVLNLPLESAHEPASPRIVRNIIPTSTVSGGTVWIDLLFRLFESA